MEKQDGCEYCYHEVEMHGNRIIITGGSNKDKGYKRGRQLFCFLCCWCGKRIGGGSA